MPSPKRRSNRRPRSRRSSAWWQRLGRLLTHRGVVGALWIVAAVICALVVVFDPMMSTAVAEWVRPRVEPGMARGVAVVLVVALVGLTGLALRRWRGETSPDRVSTGDSGPSESGPRLAMIGVGLMVVGMGLAVGDWLASHADVPAGQLVLPLDESRESVEVDQGDRTVEVMLPMRTTAHALDLEGQAPKVWVQFATPDIEIDNPSTDDLPSLKPGESLDVEGYRFVFTGLTEDVYRTRAFVSGLGDETRRDGGVVGDEVQVSIDGPTFRITDVTEDYLDVFAMAPGLDRTRAQLMLLAQRYPLGAIGPAVQLETEGGEQFWVFDRGGDRVDEAPYVDESLQVDGIQRLPSPVMTVTEVRPFWPAALGMMLFVIGWVLAFAFPERIRRRREDGSTESWSLNAIDDALASKGTVQEAKAATAWRTLPVVAALGGLGLVLAIGSTVAGILTAAAVVSLIGLPRYVEGLDQTRAVVAGLVVAAVAAVSLVVSGGPLARGGSVGGDALLWTAQIGAWLAMVVALIGAGVSAEKSLGSTATDGAVTAGLAVWAAMGAVVTLAVQRGAVLGEGLSVPLAVDGQKLIWSIPGVEAAADIEIPVVADGTELGIMAAATGLLAALGVVGAAMQRRKVALFGWIGTLATSVIGIRHLLGVGDEAGPEMPDAGVFETAAASRLEAMELPGWLAEMGEFETTGEAHLYLAGLSVELTAFVVAGVVAALMIGLTVLGRSGSGSDQTDPTDDADLAGRDQMLRAVMFGATGWILGLVLGWERLGAVGLRGPMEWLGLSAVLVAAGLLMLGWRRGPSGPEKFLGVFGPGLALCYLVWVLAVGAAGGTAPGASVPLW